MNDTTLGYVYASFPGKATWEMYYVVLKDCQMQFMPSVKHHAFISTYLVNRITIRKTKKYIAVADNSKNGQTELTKKDVLLIAHQFDTSCLFLTAPIIFNSTHNYPEFKNIILDTLMEKI